MRLSDYETKFLMRMNRLTNGNVRVCFYCRKSQRDDSENSIDTQINYLKIFKAEIEKDLGFKLKFNETTDIFQEDDRSGTLVENREEFLRMKSSICDRKTAMYSAVLVYKMDRFSRDTADTMTYYDEFERHECIVLARDYRKEGTAISKLNQLVFSGMNQYYVENSVELTVNGMINKAKTGKNVGSLPYGLYADDSNNILVDKNEADIVRMIFNLAEKNLSAKEISDDLTEKGIKNRKNQPFCENTIANMLKNEKYVGRYVWASEKKHRNRKRVYKNMIEEIVVDEAFEAIIDDKLFEKVQYLLEINRNRHKKSVTGEGYILYGLAKCADCGSNLYGSSHTFGKNKMKAKFYECPYRRKHKDECHNKNIKADYLEKVAINLTFDTVKYLFENYKDKIIEASRVHLIDYAKKIEEEKAILKKLKNDESKLIELQLKNLDLADLYVGKIKENQDKVNESTELIARLTSEYEDKKAILTRDINAGNLKKSDFFGNKLDTKILINAIFDEILVGNDTISFRFKGR